MHPLDLLKSRLDNLHQLPEKQTDIGRAELGDAGRKVADRHGLHVADAIVPELVASTEFHQKKLPQLTTLMSPARKMAVERLRRPRKPKNIE